MALRPSPCRSCGLCCDGTLFDLVPLDAEERRNLRHLPLVTRDAGFLQPCPVLTPSEGGQRVCSRYDERPRACSEFECSLHASGTSYEQALAVIAETRQLLRDLTTSARRARLEELLARYFTRAHDASAPPSALRSRPGR